jgi:hypothetical protein
MLRNAECMLPPRTEIPAVRAQPSPAAATPLGLHAVFRTGPTLSILKFRTLSKGSTLGARRRGTRLAQCERSARSCLAGRETVRIFALPRRCRQASRRACSRACDAVDTDVPFIAVSAATPLLVSLSCRAAPTGCPYRSWRRSRSRRRHPWWYLRRGCGRARCNRPGRWPPDSPLLVKSIAWVIPSPLKRFRCPERP